MDLYPAIDLRGGQCVRLYQGNYGRETVYGDDPAAQAGVFAAAGASWIHVVDLDAARTGDPVNRGAIAAVAAAVGAKVQTGGGVRDDAAADALAEAGVARVVVGTKAVEDPPWVRTLAARMPVAVGLDARGRTVATHGWTDDGGMDLVDAAKQFEDAGVEALVVTEIGRDGTLSGPAVDQLGLMLDSVSIDIIASGGVGALDDLATLAQLHRGDRSLAGVIVGRALYEGSFTVDQALAVLAKEASA